MYEEGKKKVEAIGKKRMGRFITLSEATEAANRLRISPDGSRYVIRFFLTQRVEHLILLVSFTILGITGLSQTFYDTMIGDYILKIFGGIDSIRQIHRVFAILLGVQSINHIWIFLFNPVTYRQISKFWPNWSDLKHFSQTIKLNLGLSGQRPRFDRYTFEEKIDYWALALGTVIMGGTGLIQWFPMLATEILPGWVIPAARALHKWQAILTVLVIMTWHFYHVLLKTFNTSIFTGVMTIKKMKEEHPAELLYLERAAAVAGSKKWPVFIDLQFEENTPPENNNNSEKKAKDEKNPKKRKTTKPILKSFVDKFKTNK